ncbi:hypothetical protein [Hymenobacter sp. BT491]|uniref:hypothetical protein n=1 Tax=Hymenobacter sp. BT491 TaxID=2766779 RepID=UPI001653AB64|nr:hypothetical protein [Hymenobacter sp. BT491]MBC6992233.1 hypothetical protein [Hymenobacter sp. BT491]
MTIPAEEPSTISHAGFLWMNRQSYRGSTWVEQFLTGWADRGYLLVSVAQDVAPHGDALFRQTRGPAAAPLAAADYWQRQGALHEQLRRHGLLHMPIGLGPDAAAPLALAWLVPAPARGWASALAGFQTELTLDAGLRMRWLGMLAGQLVTPQQPAQRALLQPPGADQPARWRYGNYLGDEPLQGTQCERVRTLLGALPRYARDASTPPLPADPAAAEEWPFLFNKPVGGTFEGMSRVNGHRELLASDEQQPGDTKVNSYWW